MTNPSERRPSVLPTANLAKTFGGKVPLCVLYVCTANIARSPYADRRTAMILANHAVSVTSAGVRARHGDAMDSAMAAELASRGGSGDSHRSRPVDDAAMAAADLVITLGYSHQMDLLQRWPEHADKIVGLRQLALAVTDLPPTVGPDAIVEMRQALPPASMALDVEDPYRRGKKAAAVCASEIGAALKVVVPFLARASGAESPTLESDFEETPDALAQRERRRPFSWLNNRRRR